MIDWRKTGGEKDTWRCSWGFLLWVSSLEYLLHRGVDKLGSRQLMRSIELVIKTSQHFTRRSSILEKLLHFSLYFQKNFSICSSFHYSKNFKMKFKSKIKNYIEPTSSKNFQYYRRLWKTQSCKFEKSAIFFHRAKRW